ncbi:MAG TPA: thioredoxin domain-containing protein [Chthoniobacterales bacterium]|jgi:protein-disulfide isomerase|nr:thioredoxin domain-containing protein [Chthoniobacterales bacterium]
MKRILPFLIIAAVGLTAIGIAAAVYKVKMAAAPVVTPGELAVTANAKQPAGSPEPAATEEEDVTLRPTESASIPGGKELPGVHVRGPSDAPVVIEIYGDFQCPSCGVASEAIDELQKELEGKLRVVFHQFPLSMHRYAVWAAEAAEAAALQGKFWEMHDALYNFQPVWIHASNPGVLYDSYAGAIGLDVERFREDRQKSEIEGQVIEAKDNGLLRGVRNTPTIFINGTQVKGGFTKDQLRAAIQAAFAAQGQH